MSPVARFLIPSLLLTCTLFPANVANAHAHVHYGEGLSIDLNQPYDVVVAVVQDVADDGIIRGTFEYKGGHDLEGAESAQSSQALPWTGGGKVFYKIRESTVAPEHFYESGDVGTVVVRYVVQQLSAAQTRLRIDAVFELDSHRRTLPSDGHVEDNEYEAISEGIQDRAERAAEQRRKEELQQQQKKVDEIQAQLDHENALLKTANAQEQELQAKLRQSQSGRPAQVRTAGVDLKVAPYNRSKTVQLLSAGEAVTVEMETPSWCFVETSKGEKGWVYRLNLEDAR